MSRIATKRKLLDSVNLFSLVPLVFAQTVLSSYFLPKHLVIFIKLNCDRIVMCSLGSGALKLLGRLAINPSLRQSQLARNLGTTRSAVNQLWKKLEKYNALRIGGILDYGNIGVRFIYGWAKDTANPITLQKFTRWLKSTPFTTTIYESQITSANDSRIFFEALVPDGEYLNDFFRTLRSFERAPYHLNVFFQHALEIGVHLNLGLYDGTKWQFDPGFRLEASLDGALPYAEILPVSNAVYQTTPRKPDLESLVLVSLLERNYRATWKNAVQQFETFGLEHPSARTLRRRLCDYRKNMVRPLLHIENIGLSKTIVITLEEKNTSNLHKILRAQSILFPKVRTFSGLNSIALILDIPDESDWLVISTAISNIIGSPTKMCTFIAEKSPIRMHLEDIALYIIQRSKTK